MNLIYTTHQKEIELDSYTDELILWFFGDVHYGTPSCDEKRFDDFVQKATQENAYFFSMGDTHDFMAMSDKKKIHQAGLHETTLDTLDELVTAQNMSFIRKINGMRGRLLGFIEGNHHWIFQDGRTSTEDLSQRMGAPYIGWLCHYTLCIKFGQATGSHTIHLVLCHGKAGGKTYGVTLNQVAELKNIFPASDIYVMGHDHQRVADCISVLVPMPSKAGWRLKQKEQLLCRSGSFKKSYEPGKAGYEANKLLKPANLGALKVIINFRRVRTDEEQRIYTELSAVV